MTSSGLLQYLNNTRVDATAGGWKKLRIRLLLQFVGFRGVLLFYTTAN